MRRDSLGVVQSLHNFRIRVNIFFLFFLCVFCDAAQGRCFLSNGSETTPTASCWLRPFCLLGRQRAVLSGRPSFKQKTANREKGVLPDERSLKMCIPLCACVCVCACERVTGFMTLSDLARRAKSLAYIRIAKPPPYTYPVLFFL